MNGRRVKILKKQYEKVTPPRMRTGKAWRDLKKTYMKSRHVK